MAAKSEALELVLKVKAEGLAGLDAARQQVVALGQASMEAAKSAAQATQQASKTAAAGGMDQAKAKIDEIAKTALQGSKAAGQSLTIRMQVKGTEEIEKAKADAAALAQKMGAENYQVRIRVTGVDEIKKAKAEADALSQKAAAQILKAATIVPKAATIVPKAAAQDLAVKVKADGVEGVKKALADTEKQAKATKESMLSIGNVALGNLASGLVSGAFRMLVDQARELVNAYINVNARIDQARIMLGRLYGDAGAGERALDWLLKQKFTPLVGLDAATSAFVKLKSAGIDPMSGSLQALSAAVLSFGGNAQTLDGVAVAIQQMAGKGVISMEELRQQLSEKIPTAIPLMARELGMPISDMLKQIERGNMSANQGLTALFAGLTKTYGGNLDALGNSWTSILSRMKHQSELFLKAIGDAGSFDALKGVAKGLENIKKSGLSKELAQDFSNLIENSLVSLTTGAAALLAFYQSVKSVILWINENLAKSAALHADYLIWLNSQLNPVAGFKMMGGKSADEVAPEALVKRRDNWKGVAEDFKKAREELDKGDTASTRLIAALMQIADALVRTRGEAQKTKAELLEMSKMDIQDIIWSGGAFPSMGQGKGSQDFINQQINLFKSFSEEAKKAYASMADDAKRGYESAVGEAKKWAEAVKEIHRQARGESRSTADMIREIDRKGMSEDAARQDQQNAARTKYIQAMADFRKIDIKTAQPEDFKETLDQLSDSKREYYSTAQAVASLRDQLDRLRQKKDELAAQMPGGLTPNDPKEAEAWGRQRDKIATDIAATDREISDTAAKLNSAVAINEKAKAGMKEVSAGTQEVYSVMAKTFDERFQTAINRAEDLQKTLNAIKNIKIDFTINTNQEALDILTKLTTLKGKMPAEDQMNIKLPELKLQFFPVEIAAIKREFFKVEEEWDNSSGRMKEKFTGKFAGMKLVDTMLTIDPNELATTGEKLKSALDKIKEQMGLPMPIDAALRIKPEDLANQLKNLTPPAVKIGVEAETESAYNKIMDMVERARRQAKIEIEVITKGGSTITETPPAPETPESHAAGGTVGGWSPSPRADNILARLTAGEYVQPVDAVKHYGQAMMDAIREKRFPKLPGFAEGGPTMFNQVQGFNLDAKSLRRVALANFLAPYGLSDYSYELDATGFIKAVHHIDRVRLMTQALHSPLTNWRGVYEQAEALGADSSILDEIKKRTSQKLQNLGSLTLNVGGQSYSVAGSSDTLQQLKNALSREKLLRSN